VSPVLLDTNVIVAILDKRDRDHQRCMRALQIIQQPLVTCEAVINESCYLLSDIGGAPEAVLANVEEGLFEIRFQLSRAVTSVKALMQKYRNLPIDFADACLIHMADELDTGEILTLDSDFQHYRWRRTRPFNLLIPLV
jgi:uncharacterized protein